MNSVLGFESGLVNISVPGAMVRSYIKSINYNLNQVLVVAGTNNTLNFTAPNGNALTITLTAGSFSGTAFVAALNAKFITAAAGADCGIVACTTSGNPFTFLATSNCLGVLGFNPGQVVNSIAYAGSCKLTSTKIVELSGNNSFYVTTNLGLANQSFLNPNNKGGANVLAKIQLTTDSTGIEFYTNHTSFKTRFYDSNITSLHIVLYDEDFKQWVPLSDWSCVLEFTFFKKYDLTTKLKTENLLFN